MKRARPRAHGGLSSGEPTVSTDRFDTPSGAAACGCFILSRRPRWRRVGRLVAPSGTDESSSNEDVASLDYAWSERGRERTAG